MIFRQEVQASKIIANRFDVGWLEQFVWLRDVSSVGQCRVELNAILSISTGIAGLRTPLKS